MTRVVEVGGLTVHDGIAPTEPDGSRWTFSDLDGWDDGVDVVAEGQQRPNAHGVFDEPVRRSGRLAVLTGFVACPDPATARATKRRLAATLADGSLGELRVAEEDGALSAAVRLAAAPLVTLAGWSTTVRFQLSLFAADPLRYGDHVTASTPFPDQRGGLEYDLYTDGAGTDLGYLDYGEPSTTGTVSLTNEGTADSWPQFDAAGPIAVEGFEIVRVGSGERLVFAGGVPEGSSLVLDAASGVVVIDGTADRAGLLTERGWSPVRPGESAQFVFLPRGSRTDAVLTASLRSAWW